MAPLGSCSQYRWSLLTILGISPRPRTSRYHCNAASLFLTLYVMWLIFLSRMWSGSIRSPQTCACCDRIALSYQNHVLWDILETTCERGGDCHVLSDHYTPQEGGPCMDRR